MEALKNQWESLSPELKRYLSWGGTFGVLVLVLFPFITGGQPQALGQEASVATRSVLTDDNLHNQSIDTISAQIRDIRRENLDLHNTVKGLNTELRRLKAIKDNTEGGIDHAQVERIIERKVQTQMKDVNRSMNDFKSKLKRSEAKRALAMASAGQGVEGSASIVTPPAKNIWDTTPVESSSFEDDFDEDGPSEEGDSTPSMVIRSISSEKSTTAQDEKETFNHIDFYIPAGSMIPGIFLTGIDAPTGQRASSEPHPVLVRVKKSSILPNRYRQDFRECFILGSGYGELSSERAMIRSETLSCIDTDGNVLEKPVKMYAVGEDSKVGVRGTVVRKDGQLLAAALGAGFLEGVSSAFNAVPVPTIQTDSSSGSVPYQDVYSTDTLQSGFSKGAGSALSRLSEYYMDLADEIFPVIEVGAGRQVTMVVTIGSDTSPTAQNQNPLKQGGQG